MINKPFFSQLKKEYQQKESERRQIISASNAILHDAKRVIFSLHRIDNKTALASLTDIETRLKKLQKSFGYERLEEEGAYGAGVEEYVEAKMFYLVVNKKPLGKVTGIKISTAGYLGGLSDLCGELVRQAINLAAAGKIKEARANKQIISDILAEFVEFDFTGYLRTKYDQANSHFRKMEQVDYELSLRK